MTLKHELGDASNRVPELHTPVLGAGKHPSAVGSQSDTEDEILRSSVSSAPA